MSLMNLRRAEAQACGKTGAHRTEDVCV